MSVERDSLCFHFWAHAWKTYDQYTQCLTCGQRMAPAKEDYTDHDVWGRGRTLTVAAQEGVDLGDTIEAALAELMAADANDEARSQLTDDDHDPKDY